MQPRTNSVSTPYAHTGENDVMVEIERMLAERPPAPMPPVPHERASVLRRIVPLVLLAGVGAALALVPASVKDALLTGRSVAHSPDR